MPNLQEERQLNSSRVDHAVCKSKIPVRLIRPVLWETISTNLVHLPVSCVERFSPINCGSFRIYTCPTQILNITKTWHETSALHGARTVRLSTGVRSRQVKLGMSRRHALLVRVRVCREVREGVDKLERSPRRVQPHTKSSIHQYKRNNSSKTDRVRYSS